METEITGTKLNAKKILAMEAKERKLFLRTLRGVMTNEYYDEASRTLWQMELDATFESYRKRGNENGRK